MQPPPPNPVGMRPDGSPIYQCIVCGKRKGKDAFEHDAGGALRQVCRVCSADQHRKKGGRAAHLPPRDYVTVTEQECKGCRQVKPADQFWGDRSNATGLQPHCIACTQQRRRRKRASPSADAQAVPAAAPDQEQAWALIDQAIRERDQAREALDRAQRDLAQAQTRVAINEEAAQREEARLDRILEDIAALTARLRTYEHRPTWQARAQATGWWVAGWLRAASTAIERKLEDGS